MKYGQVWILTEELVAAICAQIEAGVPVVQAIMSQGVPQPTAYSWLHRGGYPFGHDNVAHRHVDPEEAVEPWRTFVVEVTTAEARWHARLARAVTANALHDGNLGVRVLKARSAEWEKPGNAPVVSEPAQLVFEVDYETFRRIAADKEARKAAEAGETLG